MRKTLGVVVMLVVALMISANFSRAGPDDTVAVEQTYLANASLDIGTISGQLDVVRTTEQVFAVSSLSVSRSTTVVVRDTSDVEQWTHNRSVSTYGSRAIHRTDNGWRVLRT